MIECKKKDEKYGLKVFRSLNVEEVFEEVTTLAKEVNIIDDGTEPRILLHYSENDEISHFSERRNFNWTNGLSTCPKQIKNMIGITSEQFKAIYVIKCLIGNSHKIVLNDHTYFALEAQVRRAIDYDEFKVLKIRYNRKSGSYELA